MLGNLSHHVRPLTEADVVDTPTVRIFMVPVGGYLEELTRLTATGTLGYRFGNAPALIKERIPLADSFTLIAVDREFFYHPVYPEPGSSPTITAMLAMCPAGSDLGAHPAAITSIEQAGYTALARSWPVGSKAESWPSEVLIAAIIISGAVPSWIDSAQQAAILSKLHEINTIFQAAKSKSKGVSSPFSRLVASLRT